MRKLIIIFLIIFISSNLAAYNKSIGEDLGFYNIATAGAFENDAISMSSVIYNPSIISFNNTKFQMSYLHKDKNPFIDTAGFIGLNVGFDSVGYTLYLLNSKFLDETNNLYKFFNLGFALRKKIGGIISGIGLRYISARYNSNISKAENLQYSIGIKKSGKFATKNKIYIGLGFNSSVNFSWDNDFVSVKRIPSQIFLSIGLNRNDFYMFVRLNYVFPVIENLNSNYSYVKENDELRVSIGLMYDAYLFQFVDAKFLIGYKYIDENAQIVGYGVSIGITSRVNINFGGETGTLISGLNEFDRMTAGVNFEW